MSRKVQVELERIGMYEQPTNEKLFMFFLSIKNNSCYFFAFLLDEKTLNLIKKGVIQEISSAFEVGKISICLLCRST